MPVHREGSSKRSLTKENSTTCLFLLREASVSHPLRSSPVKWSGGTLGPSEMPCPDPQPLPAIPLPGFGSTFSGPDSRIRTWECWFSLSSGSCVSEKAGSSLEKPRQNSNCSRHDWDPSKPPSYGKIQQRPSQGGDSALPQAGGSEWGFGT